MSHADAARTRKASAIAATLAADGWGVAAVAELAAAAACGSEQASLRLVQAAQRASCHPPGSLDTLAEIAAAAVRQHAVAATDAADTSDAFDGVNGEALAVRR